MSAPKIIHDLVERFDNNIASYKSGNYNETQVRNEFINPFFEALGWDVINKSGYAEAYKDVIHEYSLKTKDVAKAPDYLFRIGGNKKFFVEAKKPSVNLKDDISPAFQLRRYAWSAKLPLSVLTDFEELAIYDCRIQPKKNDKSSTARVKYITYKDYIDNWDQIESIFSKEAVLKGSFDKYADTSKGKKGTTQVDDAFLLEVEKWREQLAKNIALRNNSLTNRELNFSIQKIIDRIIFLRICEDRGAEDYGQLLNLLNGPRVYERLNQIFRRADEKYNSGLFHFEQEKDRSELPDEITPSLNIDDKVLKDIFKNLYYPDCPYEFSVLGADILGHVYEQFLGKVIRLTPGHRAIIEEKPEVKKAGGVYYTPTYIVDYIVKNTLGKKLEEIEQKYDLSTGHSERCEESLKSINTKIKKAIKEASTLTILDPACGSGSFLIGAYQHLLDWHLNLYTRNVEQIFNLFKKNPPIFEFTKGDFRLTTMEKKRILLNNIYGVDIDSQAVEVTKLSLLLKVLEGETDETLTTQMNMFRERALPDLSNNIKCGNSLIAPDFFAQTELDLDEEERYKINAFDWKDEFKTIFGQGGFDVVIGNPPYFSLSILDSFYIAYLSDHYSLIHTGYNDIMYYFVYKGILLLKNTGLCGMITSNYFFGNSYSKKFRDFLLNHIKFIMNFKNYYVFKDANIHTSIMINEKDKIGEDIEIYELQIENIFAKIEKNYFLNYKKLKSEFKKDWIFANDNKDAIIKKIENNAIQLGKFCNITKGITSGSRKIFTVSESKAVELKLEFELLKKSITSKNIKRYYLENSNEFLLYIDSKTKIEKCPNILAYLKKHKAILQQRNEIKRNLYEWYRLERPREKSIYEIKPKIVVPYRAEINRFAIDFDGCFNDGGGSYAISINSFSDVNIYFLLGILNSKLLNWYYGFIGKPKGKMREYFNDPLSKIPIFNIHANQTYVKQIELVIKYVKQIIASISKSFLLKTPQEKTSLQRQIDAVDKQIDQLVYELYGLTEEEIKIVEESIG